MNNVETLAGEVLVYIKCAVWAFVIVVGCIIIYAIYAGIKILLEMRTEKREQRKREQQWIQ
jgi:hypothetical protein